MGKQFEGVFELFNGYPRLGINGDKLQIIFEKAFSEEEQKSLVDFFDQSVQVKIHEQEQEDITADPIIIDDIFGVTAVAMRKLANGNKTRFVLEKMYDRDNHRRIVELFQCKVNVFMEIIQQELPGMEDREDREDEINEEQDSSLGLELVED